MNDKWGRNFLGTPPQGRADYAFMQHILASMDIKTGRCAVLFPHGVLFRKEELEIRKELIKNDLVECVIGLGANLFYNSPMEACIIICRAQKTEKYKDKIVFINAINEVVRRNAESYLTDEHITKISKAYLEHKDIEDFCRVVTKDDVLKNDGDLNISLYVAPKAIAASELLSIKESIESWKNTAVITNECFTSLQEMINGEI